MENACSKTLSKDAVPCSALVHLVFTVVSPPPPPEFRKAWESAECVKTRWSHNTGKSRWDWPISARCP